jgi:hypothetical protein
MSEINVTRISQNQKTIDKIAEHFVALDEFSKDAKFPVETQKLYAAKASAVKKILDEQSDRILNLDSREQAFKLGDLIRTTAEYDNADASGTLFALSYVLDFYV